MIRLNVTGTDSRMISKLAAELSRRIEASGMINAKVVDEGRLREFNRDYTGRDETTDVLSFSYTEDDQSGQEFNLAGSRQADEAGLGDILISRQHISRQAKAAGTDQQTELILLLLHGTLHILGFDHQDESSRQRMDDLQRQVMSDLGLTYRDFGWNK